MRVERRRAGTTFAAIAAREARFAMLRRSNPKEAERLMALAQKDIEERRHPCEQMAGVERSVPDQEVSV
jgi:pyruvate-ferredoxin/flavodoxin oxidoreductase